MNNANNSLISFEAEIPSILEKISAREAISLYRYVHICKGQVTSPEFTEENPELKDAKMQARLEKVLKPEMVAKVAKSYESWKVRNQVQKGETLLVNQLVKMHIGGTPVDASGYGENIKKAFDAKLQQELSK